MTQALAENESAQTIDETEPQAKDFMFAKVDFSRDETNKKIQDLS